MPKPGILTGNDIFLGDVALNAIDGNNVAWIITDLDGWWGLPDVEVPDDPRPFAQDGSYYTTGRYSARTINVKGYILPLDGSSQKAVTSRNAFNRALNLVRSRTELKVREQGVDKVSLVQLSARPLLRISQASGLLEFDISLKSTDPLKYADAEKYFSVGLQTTTPGRTYPRSFDFSYGGSATTNTIEIVNEGSYASFPEFTVTGPILNPKIEHVNTGQELQFNTEVVDGQPLIIRPLTKQVLVQGQNRRNTLTPRSKWFPMYPGTNVLRFTGTQTIAPHPAYNPQVNQAFNPIPADTGSSATLGAEIRRNRFPTPRPSATTGFTHSGGTASFTSQPLGGVRGESNYLLRTLSAPVTSSGTFAVINAPAVALRTPVVAGQTYLLGASIIHSNSPSSRATFYVNWLDSAGAAVASAQTLVGQPPGPNGVWYRINNTATAPAGAAFVTIGISIGDINGWQAGDYMGVTEYVVEDTSINVGTVINPVLNPTPTDTLFWQTGNEVSKAVVTDGGAPAMEITVTTAGTTAGQLFTYVGQTSMPTVPGPGRWVSAAYEVKPMTSAVSAVMRGILRVQTGTSANVAQEVSPTGTAPAGQWTRMVITAQQPVGSVADNVDLLVWPNGVLPVGASWRIRKAIVGYGDTKEEAEAAVATYIDGNSANTATALYAWAGAANNSATLAIKPQEFFDGSTVNTGRNQSIQWTGTVNASASTIRYLERGWDTGDFTLFKTETSADYIRRPGSSSVRITRLDRDHADRRVAVLNNIGAFASGHSNAPIAFSDFQNAVSLYINPSMPNMDAVFTVRYYTSTGTLVRTAVSDTYSLAPNNWQRILFIDPDTGPANVSRMTVSLEVRYTGTDSAHIGASVSVQDTKIGVWSVAEQEYFDGNFTFAQWSGAANRSTSVISSYVAEVPAAKLYITSRDAWIE